MTNTSVVRSFSWTYNLFWIDKQTTNHDYLTCSDEYVDWQLAYQPVTPLFDEDHDTTFSKFEIHVTPGYDIRFVFQQNSEFVNMQTRKYALRSICSSSGAQKK